MASIIKLKRSAVQGAVPSTLQEAEIAVNLEDKKLYVGGVNGGANVQVLSGDLYNLTSTNGSDSATITLTVDNEALSNDSITFTAGEGIDISESSGTITISGEDASSSNKGIASFSTDNFTVSSGVVTIKDLGVATAEIQDLAVSTGKIADGAVTSAKIASKGIQANNIADGIITSAMISAGGVTANAIGNDSVALGTKTTGNYVATIADAGTGDIVVSGSGSETAAVTLDLADSITSNTSGTAATASALTSAVTVTLTGDVTGTASFTNAGDTASITTTIAPNSVALGTDTTGNYVAGISGTSNEIEVSGSGSENATVTIGLPTDVSVAGQLNVGENVVVAGNTSIAGNLTVDGDLNVEGALTYLATQTVQTDDSMIKLSANNIADTIDHGVYSKYVDGVTTKYAGYFRDASDGSTFKFYKDLQVEPTSTVNVAGTGYTLATIDAVIDGGTY